MKIKGYVVDSNKIEGSYAQRYRGNAGSYGFIGSVKRKTKQGPYRPQGAFISKSEARKFNLNQDELVEVQIDKKDLLLSGDFDGKNKNYFPKYGAKYEIIEAGYKPNKFNVNNYKK